MNKFLQKTIAIDIGGTKISIAVINKCKICDIVKFETDRDYKKTVLRIKEELAQFDIADDLPVGISICGLLSQDKKKLLMAPNLGWHNLLISEIFKPLKRKFIVVNDGTAAVWASYVAETSGMSAPNNKTKRLLAVTLGTGVGGGVVIDGKLLFGAGELGHIKIDIDGPPCACGSRGCLEVFGGGKYIPLRAKEWFSIEVSSAEELYKMAKKNVPVAIKFWERYGEILGWGLSGVVNLCGIEKIAIGGNITDAESYFLPSLKKSLAANLMVSKYQKCDIFISKFRRNMSLIGASLLWRNKL